MKTTKFTNEFKVKYPQPLTQELSDRTKRWLRFMYDESQIGSDEYVECVNHIMGEPISTYEELIGNGMRCTVYKYEDGTLLYGESRYQQIN